MDETRNCPGCLYLCVYVGGGGYYLLCVLRGYYCVRVCLWVGGIICVCVEGGYYLCVGVCGGGGVILVCVLGGG